MQSRREFHARLIGSAIAFGLIETLWSRDLFADDAKPTVGKWLGELAEMTKDLKGQKLTDLQFQQKMEDLYRRVNLADLCALIKLDDVEKTKKLPDNGAGNFGFDLSKVEGLPAEQVASAWCEQAASSRGIASVIGEHLLVKDSEERVRLVWRMIDALRGRKPLTEEQSGAETRPEESPGVDLEPDLEGG